MSCSKKTLYAVNFILFVFGAVLTGVATWGVKHMSKLDDSLNSAGTSIALVSGIALMCVAFLGCFGVCKADSGFGRCLLKLYILVMVLIVILQLVAAAVVLVYVGKLGDVAEGKQAKLDSSIDKVLSKAFDACCPVESKQDSCWIPSSIATKEACVDEDTFDQTIAKWLRKRLRPLGIVAAVFVVVETIVTIMSCVIHSRGKKQQKAKEAAHEGYAHFNAAEHGQAPPHAAVHQGQAVRY